MLNAAERRLASALLSHIGGRFLWASPTDKGAREATRQWVIRENLDLKWHTYTGIVRLTNLAKKLSDARAV